MRIVLILFFISTFYTFAQPKEDTIRVYRLGEIVTEGTSTKTSIQPTKIKEIEYYEIQEQDALSFEEINSVLPGGFIQTNSRGESLIYLRGASERSISLFFDGVYFNVPWDNRLNLTMIPTDIIGNIKITNGGNSVLYGANVMGGAVNITTTERNQDGIGGKIRLQAGQGTRRYSSVTLDGKDGNFNFLANISYAGRDGLTYSNENNTVLRTGETPNLIPNSDMERISIYGRTEYNFNEYDRLGLSINYIDGEQGVIPENNPEEINSRFWRYPSWSRTLTTLNGYKRFSDKLNLKGAIWFDNYSQDINNYTSIRYDEINEKQFDTDVSIGLRMLLNYDITDEDILNFTINGYNTNHNELIESDTRITEADFAQNTSSIGIEYKKMISDLVLTAGVSWDRFETIEAGSFTEAEGNIFQDYGAVIGASWIMDNFKLFTNISRKTRFPTLRESYSAALNKFLVNDNLRPETGILTELGFNYDATKYNATFTLFYNNFSDLIAKSQVPNDTLEREQRINLDDAGIVGAEFVLYYYITDNLDISSHLTFMQSQGTIDGEDTNLEYKPRFIGFLQADWRFADKFDFLLELDYRGMQYGLSDIEDGIVQIDPTLLVNSRISYKFLVNDYIMTLFVRGNNLLDTFRVNKIGIPSQGRNIFAGVNIGF